VDLEVEIERKEYVRGNRRTCILQDVRFRVPSGSITCIYGRSGCGKTTALRIIAGLDTDYRGHVRLGDALVGGPTQQIGMVVQTPLAFDWLTVAGNLTFGLRYIANGRSVSWWRRLFGVVDTTQMLSEAERLSDLVGLSRSDLAKRPLDLSGGMKQRMAFGRALLLEPQVLLLDEPFSSLDFDARQSLQDLVLKIRRELGTTIICVSHDPEEVLYLADQVVVVDGSPAQVVHQYAPAIPGRGLSDARYSEDFQSAKRYLRSFGNGVSNHSSPAAISSVDDCPTNQIPS
jgi:ABC-type nitrate/sulfonate/bicarbonate transport system ATPase subunit